MTPQDLQTPWIDIQYQCAKCRKLHVAFPPDIEGYIHEFFAHYKDFQSDNYKRVKPVCPDCFAEHFAQYETLNI